MLPYNEGRVSYASSRKPAGSPCSTRRQFTQEWSRTVPLHDPACRIPRELGVPVRFVGLGEGIDDLEEFDADSFVEALFQ